jgi:hypothetical protein
MPASFALDQLYLYFPFKALRLLHVSIETPLKGICIATTQVMYVFRMIFRTAILQTTSSGIFCCNKHSVFCVTKEQKFYTLFRLTSCIKLKYFFDKNFTSEPKIIEC